MSDELRRAEMESVLRRAEMRHGVPALLSFFIPGLGQLVKGSFLKGFLVWGLLTLGAILCMAYVGFAMIPVVWIWQLYDAYVNPDEATATATARLSQRP